MILGGIPGDGLASFPGSSRSMPGVHLFMLRKLEMIECFRTLELPLMFFFSLQEKLKRLIKYLNFKDVKSKSQKQTSQDDYEVLEASG